MSILPRSFYERSPLLVAPELLGKILVRQLNGEKISGRIVEVEAYLAYTDEAAHSFRGLTKRNASLFKEAGTAYVYSIHQQFCLDIVVEKIDIPGSVLIRALEPLEGITMMKKFRNKERLFDLTSGPGKLTQALKIDKTFDGITITNSTSLLYLVDGFIPDSIARSKRVGISKAKEFDYRFYIKNSPYVSKKKPRISFVPSAFRSHSIA